MAVGMWVTAIGDSWRARWRYDAAEQALVAAVADGNDAN